MWRREHRLANHPRRLKRIRSISDRWYSSTAAVGIASYVAIGLVVLCWLLKLPPWARSISLVLTLVLVTLSVFASRRRARRLHDLIESDWRRCPSCFFDLRGLPDHGMCPECGGRYVMQHVREAWKDHAAALAEDDERDSY